MSDLFSVIKDIVSLVNNKFGSDVLADTTVCAYTPELDEKKEEFTKEDIKWLLNILKSHSFSGGVKGLVKRMGDKFNNDLKQTIYDASRVHGDIEGVVKFLTNYDKLKDKLPKGKSPENKSRSRAPDMDIEDTRKLKLKGESIKSNIKRVKEHLKEVKEKHPKEYEGSFYQHTDKVMTKLLDYLNSSAKSTKIENDFIELFTTDDIDDKYGLLKGWKRLRVKNVTPAIEDIYLKITSYFEHPKPLSEKEILDPPKVDMKSLTDLEKDVHKLEKNRPSVDEPEIEVNKKLKEDKRKDIREEVKDVDSEDKYKYSLDIIKNYFEKAKKSYPTDFDEYSLHKYTSDLISAMDDYYKGEGRDADLNKKIADVFNESPGIVKIWEEIHKPISKRLRELKSAFGKLVKTTKGNPEAIKKDLYNKLEKLSSRANIQASDKDKTIAKGLLGKKERDKLKRPKDIDPEQYNNVLKHLVKNIENLPKNPKKKDFVDSLPENSKEKDLFDNEAVMNFFSKVIHLIDDIKNDNEDISDSDLIAEVKKNIEESEKPKPDERKVVMDRDLVKEQEEAKNKPEAPEKKKKESSTNILDHYRETIFYKLSVLAENAPDRLVKAELESIEEEIKHLL